MTIGQEIRALAAARPTFPEEDLPAILERIAQVLRGGRLILGPFTRELEEAWAKRIGTAHAVALSSCTAALEIAFRFAAVAGREVVVPSNTFVATANAALAAGAVVRFAETDPADFCLDVDHALSLVGPRTAAVVAVHVAGFVSHAFAQLRSACRERGVALIEDCAHAHGATLGDAHAGALADAGCFSLYPTKILTAGVGGVLTTDSGELAAFARSLRHHGAGASLEAIELSGNDWVMDEVRAVLALSQLARLDDFLARRRAIAARYDALLAGDRRLLRARAGEGMRPAYYKYPVLLGEGIDRDAVRRELGALGVEVGALYSPPCHLMPVFRELPDAGLGRLPCTEALLARQICLPMHAAMCAADADRAVSALDHALRRCA